MAQATSVAGDVSVLPSGAGLDASETATAARAAAIEAAEARRAAVGIGALHPSERQRLRAEQEAEAERLRRAGPDPREALREAHRLRGQALADVEHHCGAVERARALSTEIETRISALEAGRKETEAEQAAALAEALEAGAPPRVNGRKNGASTDAIEAAGHELNVAQIALARLQGELDEAEAAAGNAEYALRGPGRDQISFVEALLRDVFIGPVIIHARHTVLCIAAMRRGQPQPLWKRIRTNGTCPICPICLAQL
jgi:colicin import membrane protein